MSETSPSAPHLLRDLYRRMYRHFGYAAPWWPGSPLEIVLTAILVQRCNWSVAWTSVARLRQSDLLSLPNLAAATPDAVERCIKGVAFAARKADRLIGLARKILANHHGTVEEFLAPARGTATVRGELLDFDGVGPETADAILLFASEHPVFVIDEYTRRIFQRLDPFPYLGTRFWVQPYQKLRAFFEDHIIPSLGLYDEFALAPGVPRTVALLRDWHAQLVEVGKHHCRKTSPHCHYTGGPCWHGFAIGKSHCQPPACLRCPLSDRCAFAETTRPAAP